MLVERVTPVLLVRHAIFLGLLQLLQVVTVSLSITQLNLFHYAQDILKRNIMGDKLLHKFGEKFRR